MGGRLELSIRPEDASVYVDGAFRGSAREASTLRLAPGRHRIEIVRPGYKTLEREVEVAPGQPTASKVELEKPSQLGHAGGGGAGAAAEQLAEDAAGHGGGAVAAAAAQEDDDHELGSSAGA